MNSAYEESLDENFNYACTLCTNKFSKQELLEFLKNGNISEKQFAAIEISSIDDESESDILISNLINCDGKIREAVAYKLSQIIQYDPKLYTKYADILAAATIDINANICRTIIEILFYLKPYDKFVKEYTSVINGYIEEVFIKLDNFKYKDRKYVINKQLFKLYWCLESINVFYSFYDEKYLYEILKKCSEIREYTIREKVAQILKNDFSLDKLNNLKQVLASDTNYYVKNI